MSSAHTTTAPRTAEFVPQIRLYQEWLRSTRGLSFDSYDALWRWSTTELDAFWQSIWDYFDLQSPTPHSAVLARNVMPGAQWFPGAQVNYVQQVLRHVQPAHAAGMPAVISRNEQSLQRELSWPELHRQVAALALHLRAQGVGKGDRVAAYLPNIPEAIVAFLACASLGAIWSICAPDMGTNAVLDRFKQIAPKALIAVDGVHYAGKDIDRREVVQELRQGLPSVQHVVLVPNLDAHAKIADTADYTSVTARNDAETAAFEPMWLPFDHPLWVVYSSGTTGLPKPIVHAHGGMILVMLMLAVTNISEATVLSQLLGAAIVGGAQMLIALCGKKRMGIGGADIKLSTAAALLLGFYKGVIGFMLGLLIAVVAQLIITHRKKEQRTQPFALLPYLSVGFIIGYLI